MGLETKMGHIAQQLTIHFVHFLFEILLHILTVCRLTEESTFHLCFQESRRAYGTGVKLNRFKSW